jgi:hypothetical protein
MTALVVPTSPDDPFYSQTSELDGVEYILIFRYNQREKSWYLSLQDSEEIEILSGLKLVCDIPLFGLHRGPKTPPGELMVLSGNGDTTSPDIGELGPERRCQLYYLPLGV